MFLAIRHWSCVEAYKRKICQKMQRILECFGEEILVWCLYVQEEDLSQKSQRISACFFEKHRSSVETYKRKNCLRKFREYWRRDTDLLVLKRTRENIGIFLAIRHMCGVAEYK